MTTIDWDTIPRCGAGRFSTGPDDPFAEECVIHDERYIKGGEVEAMWDADVEFYKGIWKKALKKPWLIPRAALYCLAVNMLARYWWRREDRSQQMVELLKMAYDAGQRSDRIETALYASDRDFQKWYASASKTTMV